MEKEKSYQKTFVIINFKLQINIFFHQAKVIGLINAPLFMKN